MERRRMGPDDPRVSEYDAANDDRDQTDADEQDDSEPCYRDGSLQNECWHSEN